jgi:hypothetical protein
MAGAKGPESAPITKRTKCPTASQKAGFVVIPISYGLPKPMSP